MELTANMLSLDDVVCFKSEGVEYSGEIIAKSGGLVVVRVKGIEDKIVKISKITSVNGQGITPYEEELL